MEISEKDKQAVALRSKGHTYTYIAEKLDYENAEAAAVVIAKILRDAEVARLASVNDGEFNNIYEVNIRLTTKGGDPRVPFRVRLLMEALYEAEAEWEREMGREHGLDGLLLQEPTTFSVSKVVVDQAPQTGKHAIFPEV